MINHILYVYMLHMLYVGTSEQIRFLDIRHFINKNYYYVSVLQFLMSFIWPKYKVGNKIEEKVPSMLKQLGYPFSITKSAMFSVGSPLTWPALLAALSWMREQIEV